MILTQKQIELFDQDGYLILEDFVSPKACESLRNRASEIVENFEPAELISIFTTNDQIRHSDKYFLIAAVEANLKSVSIFIFLTPFLIPS